MKQQTTALPDGTPADNGVGITPPAPAGLSPDAARRGQPGPPSAAPYVVSGAKVEIGLMSLAGGLVTNPQTLTCEAGAPDQEGLREALKVAVDRAVDRLEQLQRGEP